MTSEHQALLEAASELGARRALARLGLADERARDDINELRQLLGAWRDAKSSARREVINWIVRGFMAVLLIGLAVKLGLTEIGDEMRFAGYAALFDRVDRGGDVIRKGAFREASAPVPLYWQHDPSRRIGTVEVLREDARGLRVIGRSSAPVARGTGLSFGYRVRSADHRTYRELKSLELVEVSLVRSPMQPLARVHAIEEEKWKMDYEVKADALEASFDNVDLPPERPVLAATPAATATAFDAFLRRGETVELKSFTGANNPDGGFAVPREIDARVDTTLKAISPIRRIANVVRVGTAGYRKLVTQNGVASGWATEVGARPETATPVFNEIVPPMGDLYANPAASQFMLDDAAFDVEEWLASEIATEFARAEGAAFVGGNGTNRPRGFLTLPTAVTTDATRPFGTLQYVASGAAGAFAASNPQDRLVDLVQALRPPYRQGATWVMNSKTLATLRKFKTTDGAFLWQPSLIVGNADTLLGYPVVEAEDMPDIATDSLSIAFGNFQAGYIITERAETQILRDPYSNKPFVYFYATKRVGGTVTNSEAIKVMKFAVS